MTTTKRFNEAYPKANSLQIGSAFKFVYDIYTVVRFLKNHIIATNETGKEVRFYVFDFEGYCQNGTLNIL